MPKFTIPVTRIGYGYRDIEVEAESQEEAENKALDEAGNYKFSEKESDYIIQDVPELMNSVELKNKIFSIRENIEYSLKKLVKNVVETYKRVNSDVESVDDTSWIELPVNVVFLDMEDGNLIEAIERISTGGQKVETFLHGDGTERDLDELTEGQMLSVMEQLEGMLNANSDQTKIEIN